MSYKTKLTDFYPELKTTVRTPQNNGGVLGGLGYTTEKIGLGALQGIEGIWDYTAGGLAKIFGADQWAERQFKNDWVNYQHADDWYNPSEGWQVAGDVAGGIGTSLPSIAGAAAGGAIIVGSGGTAAPAGIKLIGASMAPLVAGLASAGTSTKEAYRETGNLGGKEFGYGALSGLAEGGMEFVTQGIGAGTGRIAKSILAKTSKDTAKTLGRIGGKNVLKSIIGDFASEAFEEGTQEMLSPVFKRMTYDPNAQNASPEEIAYSALVGGLSGAIMGGAYQGINTVSNIASGTKAVNTGSADFYMNAAKNISETEAKNETGFEAFKATKEAYEKLQESLSETNGVITTARQKKLLGEIKSGVTASAFLPYVERSAMATLYNAETVAERLSKFKMTDAEGNPIRFTVSDITKGIDMSLANSTSNAARKLFLKQIRKALSSNSALATVAIMDTTGHLMMDTQAFADAMIKGSDLASKADLNYFAENATQEEINAIQTAFDIPDISNIGIDEFRTKIAEAAAMGKMNDYLSQIDKINSAKRIVPEFAEPMPLSFSEDVADGAYRFTDDANNLAILKDGKRYRIYDYGSNQVSRELNVNELNDILGKQDKQKIETPTLKQEAQELEELARAEIKDYSKLNASNQAMIRGILRNARRNGISEVDALAFAKVSAHSGLDIRFDKEACYRGKDKNGKKLYADGFYSPKENKIIVNPESSRSLEKTLIHELDHAIRMYYKEDGKIHSKAYKTALESVSGEDTQKIAKAYKNVDADVSHLELLLDETNAYAAEQLLSNKNTLEKLVEEEPSIKDRILKFFRGASKDYSGDAKLEKAAKKYYKTYKKLFDEFSARNQQSNSIEAPTEIVEEKSKRYAFAGVNAKEADKTALDKAIAMDSEGKDSEAIRQETGWFKGYDGKWRFEIDDSKFEYNPEGITEDLRKRFKEYKEAYRLTRTGEQADFEKAQKWMRENDWYLFRTHSLDSYVSHPTLFKHYPQLKDLTFAIEDLDSKELLGMHEPDIHKITISDKANVETAKSTLIHEIQHEIQGIEGFAEGSVPELFEGKNPVPKKLNASKQKAEAIYDDALFKIEKKGLKYLDMFYEFDEIEHDWLTKEISSEEEAKMISRMQAIENAFAEAGYKELFEDAYRAKGKLAGIKRTIGKRRFTPYGAYLNTAGEIEARNTSARLYLDKEGRKATRPDIDQEDYVFAEDYRYALPVDQEYKSALESGDMEKANRLVEKAAKEAGYDIKAYHGTPYKRFNVFKGDAIFFSLDERFAENYANIKNFDLGLDGEPIIYEVFLNSKNIFDPMNDRQLNTLVESLPGEIEYGFARETFSKEEFKDRLKGKEKIPPMWDKSKIEKAKFGEIIGESSEGYNDEIYVGIKDNKVYTLDKMDKTFLQKASEEQIKDIMDGQPVKMKLYEYVDIFTGQSVFLTEEENRALKEGKNKEAKNLMFKKEKENKLKAYKHSLNEEYTEGNDTWSYYELSRLKDGTDVLDVLKKQGYNSVKMTERGSDNIVVFNPNQIKSADTITYDDNGKVIPLSERFNEKNNDIRYAINLDGTEIPVEIETKKNLVAIHNLDENKLIKTLELGGIPAPSIAIVKSAEGHNDFGDISVIFGKDTIDPALSKENKVYSSDAWTPMFPYIDVLLDHDAIENSIKELQSDIEKHKDYLYDIPNFFRQMQNNNGEYILSENSLSPSEFALKGKEYNGMMAAYLMKNQSNADTEPIYSEPLYSSKFTYAELERLYKEMEVNAENFDEKLSWDDSQYEENLRKIKEALYRKHREKFGEKVARTLANEADERIYNRVKNDAMRYFNKQVSNKSSYDRYATKDKLYGEIKDKEKFGEWLYENYISKFVVSKGIRNSKDIFTASGKRRDFNALHNEYNLNNLIKAMKEEGQKGIGAFGKNIFGSATEEYKSLSEIKERANERLHKETNEIFESRKKEFLKRYNDIVDQFIKNGSFDSVSDLLLESAIKYKTKQGIQNYIKREGQGWTNYSQEVVNDFIDLLQDIRNTPIGYFEAKPQRAIAFDEIKMIELPDTASTKLKSMLDKHNIPYEVYGSTDEQRTQAINKLNNVRFALQIGDIDVSTKGKYAIDTESAKFIDDINKQNSIENFLPKEIDGKFANAIARYGGFTYPRLYRGMEAKELQFIKDNGYIKSNSSYNFSYQQGETRFSPKVRTALSYATGFAPAGIREKFFDEGKPAYIVEVGNYPEINFKSDGNDESFTKERIDKKYITRILELKYNKNTDKVYAKDISIDGMNNAKGEVVYGSPKLYKDKVTGAIIYEHQGIDGKEDGQFISSKNPDILFDFDMVKDFEGKDFDFNKYVGISGKRENFIPYEFNQRYKADSKLLKESAYMSDERIDNLIEDSGAGMRKDYAKAWITSINPTDFINMSTGQSQNRAIFDKTKGEHGSTMSDYDFMQGLKNSKRQTPFLDIEFPSGKVVGHEGRHRMRALEMKGIEKAEIQIRFYDEDGYPIKEMNGYGNPLNPIKSLKIINQFGTGQTTSIENIIPLNKANRELILENYGERVSKSDKDIRFALPDDYDVEDFFSDDYKEENLSKVQQIKLKNTLAKGTPRAQSTPDKPYGTVKKLIANSTHNKVYSRDTAMKVINQITGSKLSFSEKSKMTDALWQGLNDSTTPGKRDVFAKEMAEYITARLLTDGTSENPDVTEAMNRMLYFKRGTGKLTFSETDKGEIKHISDVDGFKKILGRWVNKRKNGTPYPMATFVNDIATEMPGMSHLSEMHPVDAFMEINQYYENVASVLSEKYINAYWDMPDTEIPAMENEIENVILDAFKNEGEKTKFAKAVEKRVEYLQNKANQYKKDYDTIKSRNKYLGRLVNDAYKMRDLKIGAFKNATQADTDIFRKSIESLAKVGFQGNVNVSGTKKILGELRKWYRKDNPVLNYVDESTPGLYAQSVVDMLDYLSTSPKAFSNDDLVTLHNVMSYFIKFVEGYGKIQKGGKYVEARPVAEKYVSKISNIAKHQEYTSGIVKRLANNSYFKGFSDPMAIARIMDRYDEEGFFTETLNELRSAAIKADMAELKVKEDYNKFILGDGKGTKKKGEQNNEKYISQAKKQLIEFRNNKISKMQLIGLYMTLKRKHAQAGYLFNGFKYKDSQGNEISVPGIANYKEFGKMADTNEQEKRIQGLINTELAKIKEKLTEKDLEYIGILEKVYNTDTKRLKAERDMERLGFTNANEEYYYPIRRADTKVSVDSPMLDEINRVTNSSFNKDTIKGAKQKLMIEDADSLFNRHVHAVCQYAMLTPAVEAFDVLYNMDVSGNPNAPVSVRTESANTFKDSKRYFQELVKDIQGIKDSASFGMKTLGFLRSGYAKYQLGANPKTWLTQFSSFFASSHLLDADSIIKGMTLSTNDVYDYSDVAKLRSEDNQAIKADALIDKVGRFSDILMQPIQKTDDFVVKRLFGACQVQVQKDRGLKIGTKENKEAAAKLLDKVIFETQQNSLATEKSMAMRSPNEIMRSITMFTSDAMKGTGRLIDAIGRYFTLKKIYQSESSIEKIESKAPKFYDADNNAYTMGDKVELGNDFTDDFAKAISSSKEGEPFTYGNEHYIIFGAQLYNVQRYYAPRRVTSKQVEEAAKQVRKSIAAFISVALFTASLSALWRRFLKRDEDDENKVKSMFEDAVGNLFAGLPLFKDVYSFMVDGFELENYTYSTINDLMSSTKGLVESTGKLGNADASRQDVNRAIRNMTYSLGQVFGLPFRNVYNLLFGLTKRFAPEAAYKIDNEFYKKNYESDLEKAIERGDEKMTGFIMDLLLNQRTASDINPKVFNELLKLSQNGHKVLPRVIPDYVVINDEKYTLSPQEHEELGKYYSEAQKSLVRLFESGAYKQFTDEEKAESIKLIYGNEYRNSFDEVFGISKSKQSIMSKIIGADKLAVMKIETKGLKDDLDRSGSPIKGSKRAKVVKYINGTSGLTDAQKLLMIISNGYALKDGDLRGIKLEQLRRILLAYITKSKLSKYEKEYLAKMSGFEVKNGRIINPNREITK